MNKHLADSLPESLGEILWIQADQRRNVAAYVCKRGSKRFRGEWDMGLEKYVESEVVQEVAGRSLDESETRERIRQLASEEISRILAVSGPLINPSELASWRPTSVTVGVIDGLGWNVRCLATDGNRALFSCPNGEDTQLGKFFIGHIQRFAWLDPEGRLKYGTPPPMFTSGKADSNGKPQATEAKPKKPSAKAQLKAALEAVLDTL